MGSEKWIGRRSVSQWYTECFGKTLHNALIVIEKRLNLLSRPDTDDFTHRELPLPLEGTIEGFMAITLTTGGQKPRRIEHLIL